MGGSPLSMERAAGAFSLRTESPIILKVQSIPAFKEGQFWKVSVPDNIAPFIPDTIFKIIQVQEKATVLMLCEVCKFEVSFEIIEP